MAASDGIAVLIPTLNEAPRIGPLLAMLGPMGFAEIIVADGGSTDGTLDIARGVRGVAAGCFRLRFDVRSPLLDVYAWFSRFETPLTTFGDQGYFMRRSTLMAAGGVPEWLLLEDVELRRRLKQVGWFKKLDADVITSARRFRASGALRGQLRNIAVLAGYWAGVRIETLYRFYGAGKTS